MVYVLVLLLLLGVVVIVSEPLRRGASATDDGGGDGQPQQKSDERLDLEAARDAKYREIRDAELDHQTGKLSDADFEAVDSTLRAEAIELLRRLDALKGRE